MPNNLEIMQELVKEDIELMNEVILEDIVPLVEFRERLEKKAANKAIDEMHKLEEEE